jgi:retron-type reverse transcriptase
VREVEIPKSDGGIRKLGIPTVEDRIAQQVIKSYLEPRLDRLFHASSYGYRSKKNAHQALRQVQRNCRRYFYCIDMDIKSFFDEVSYDLLMKALRKHVSKSWVLRLIETWLRAPI